MKESDIQIHRFIEKVADIQKTNSEKGLSEDELKVIAFEMGMTEEEWLLVEKTFRDHLTRGKGFLSYQNWDDALVEFHSARAIYPNHIDLLFSIARAYKGRWISRRKKEDRENAMKNARLCLRIDPAHRESLQLISTLKQTKKPVRKAIIFLSVFCVMMFILFLIILLLPSVQTIHIPVPPETIDPVIINNIPEQPDEKENQSDISSLSMNQIFIPYITCINRHSERIYQSYNRYIFWIDDPDKGPTSDDGTVYGLYNIYDSESHLDGVKQMNDKAGNENSSMYRTLSTKGNDYLRAFEGLKPILADALEYYEYENYKDDNFERGRELHFPLISAFKRYIETETALRTFIDRFQIENRAKTLESLFMSNKFTREYQVLYLSGRAYQAVLDAVQVDRDIHSKNLFFQSLEFYEKGLKEFLYLAETEKKTWEIPGTFSANYEDYRKTLTLYRRAVEKGNTRERYRTGTIYEQLIDDVNRTIETCNYYMTSTFRPEFQFLWFKIPIQLLSEQEK